MLPGDASPTAPNYDDEWHTFATVLAAHAEEEERDMIPFPPSEHVTNQELEQPGDKTADRIESLRESAAHSLRVTGREALPRAAAWSLLGDADPGPPGPVLGTRRR